MKKLLFVIALVILGIIIAGICIETYSPENRKKSKEYQDYAEKQKLMMVNNYLSSQLSFSAENRNISLSGGTTGAFEGPQIHIEYLKFHEKHYNFEGSQMSFFDGNTLNFDPDHPYFGLPNVIAKVSPVAIYEPDKSGLASLFKFGQSGSDPKPYKIYHKTIIPKTDSLKLRDFEMQLWVTEFKITVAIEPARKDPPIAPTHDEKNNIKYPGYWYGSTQNFIKLGDLKEEWKNNRYSDLTFIMKILPNNAPWYYLAEDGRNAKPGIGIAAVYCESIAMTREEDEQRVSPNIQKGSVLFLHPAYDPSQQPADVDAVSENLDMAANKILSQQENKIDSTISNSFWNKPFYFRIFFNNIGSWKEGILGQRKYDDQVTFNFIMPVFVIGSWDIIAPSEIIPEWDPPKPYFKDFFKNIIPSFGIGTFGKIIAGAGWVIIAVFVLALLFPAVSAFIKKMIRL